MESGYEREVRLLLKRWDIDLNTSDTEYGQTLLLQAMEHGYDEIAKLLLEREDINPNTQTPNIVEHLFDGLRCAGMAE